MRKSLSLLLVALLIVSSFGPMSYASDEISYGSALQSLGIIKGDANGNLNGSKALTRGELIAIINTLTVKSNDKFETPAKASFSDVPTNHWAYKIVERAKVNNITQGVGNGKFGINDKVTYQQAQAFMLNMLGYNVKWNEVESFAESIGIYCKEAVDATTLTRDMMFEILWHSMLGPTIDSIPFIDLVISNDTLDFDLFDVYKLDSELYLYFLVEEEQIFDMSTSNFDKQIPVLSEEIQKNWGTALSKQYLNYYSNVAFSPSTYADFLSELGGSHEHCSTINSLDAQSINNAIISFETDGTIEAEVYNSLDSTYIIEKTTFIQDSVWMSNSDIKTFVLNLSHPQDSSVTLKVIFTFDYDYYGDGNYHYEVFSKGI